MATFEVPEVERFEFKVPGDDTEYSVPSMLDLPPEKFKALAAAGEEASDDPSQLHALVDSLPEDGDEATQKALRGLSLGQKVKFFKAYGEAADPNQGESSAS